MKPLQTPCFCGEESSVELTAAGGDVGIKIAESKINEAIGKEK